MKETYWNQFMMTGSIADYLNYKMENRENENIPDGGVQRPEGEEVHGSAAGSGGFRKEQSESDCIDGNGAVHNAGGRV